MFTTAKKLFRIFIGNHNIETLRISSKLAECWECFLLLDALNVNENYKQIKSDEEETTVRDEKEKEKKKRKEKKKN